MQCQYSYDCDPGETHAKPCPDKATATAQFTYRHGDAKSAVPMCAYHAKVSTDNLNRWGKPYGHSARVLPLTPTRSPAPDDDSDEWRAKVRHWASQPPHPWYPPSFYSAKGLIDMTTGQMHDRCVMP